MAERLEAAARLVDGAGRIVLLTGAGISLDSGIPDFRGPRGLWTPWHPEAEKALHIDAYTSSRRVREANWRMLVDMALTGAKPNAGHEAVVELEKQGKLELCVTHSVDGLLQRAGLPEARLLEVNGSLARTRCLSCGQVLPTERAIARIRAGEADPPCETCGGLIKPAVLMFGESLAAEDLQRASAAAAAADLCMTVGTALSVYPVGGIVPRAVAAGAKLVIVNGEATEMDDPAAVLVSAPIVQALPRMFRVRRGAGCAGPLQAKL